MIHRVKDRRTGEITVTIECDTSGCTSTHEGSPGDDFSAVWADAKSEGWTTRKIANEWMHGCKSCGAPT